ncbi:MAG: bifunctional 2-polyprenyl-6-hydroxyphenol methylase/3-demethylubiquinol 3-O-methyltransferase UbiG [Alphaproteobacteria bacterium]
MPRKTASHKVSRPASALREEVAKFDALAASWWDEDGPMQPLHRVNPARLEFIREAVAGHVNLDPARRQPYKGLSFLDLGCGGGILAEPLARLGAAVTGVDAAPEAIRAARAHAAGAGLRVDYRQGSAEQLRAAGEKFSCVCALEIIEHVADPAEFLRDVTHLVAPGGLLIVSTLNRTAKSLVLGIGAAEYLLGWVPRGTHDWRKFVKPSELGAMLRSDGFGVKKISGLVFDPLKDIFRLDERDVAVNYLVAAAEN